MDRLRIVKTIQAMTGVWSDDSASNSVIPRIDLAILGESINLSSISSC